MTSILLTDGFDMYNGTGANTGLQARWTAVNWYSPPSLVAGRFGGQAMQFGEDRYGDGNSQKVYFGNNGTPSQFTVGCATQFSTIVGLPASATFCLFNVMNGLNYQCGIRFNPDGSIAAYRMTGQNAGTLLGTSAANAVPNTGWHWLDFSGVISTSTGSITIKIDGTAVLTLTGQNTQGYATSPNIDTLLLDSRGTLTNMSLTIDDLYILDNATTFGECRIETLRPAGDNTKTFTPDTGTTNYNRVNETLVDGDTTYVQASAVGNRDLYSIGSLSSTPANVYGVNVVAFARKTDATARTLANSIHSGTTDSDGSAQNLQSGYSRLDRILNTDPNTGAAWAPTAVNALLIGPKVVS